MRGDRKILRRLLEKRFIPLLEVKGFERLPLPEKDRKSGAMKWAFPLGRLRRVKGADHEVIEIQFDRYGGAKFTLNFGVVPPDGLDLPWGHFSQDEASASGLPERCRLHSCRGCLRWFSPSWFSPSLFSRRSDRETQIAKAVDRAIKLLPEVEAWFETGKVGRHVKRTRIQFSLEQAAEIRKRAEKLRAAGRLDG